MNDAQPTKDTLLAEGANIPLLIERLRGWPLGEIGRQAAAVIERLQEEDRQWQKHGLCEVIKQRDEYKRLADLAHEEVTRLREDVARYENGRVILVNEINRYKQMENLCDCGPVQLDPSNHTDWCLYRAALGAQS